MSIFEHDAEGSGVAELPGTATGHAFVAARLCVYLPL